MSDHSSYTIKKCHWHEKPFFECRTESNGTIKRMDEIVIRRVGGIASGPPCFVCSNSNSATLNLPNRPVNEEMYVTNGANPGEVNVIDTNTNTVVGNPVSVGSQSRGITYEPVHKRMYVANFESDSVSVIQIPQQVDPATAIQELIVDVRTLDDVNFFVKLVLISQLRIALIFVSDSSTANEFISCGAMNAFIATVSAYENRGRLTEAQADRLIQQAEVIRESIGCIFSSAQQTDAVEAASEAVEELTAEPRPPNSDITNTPSAMFLPN